MVGEEESEDTEDTPQVLGRVQPPLGCHLPQSCLAGSRLAKDRGREREAGTASNAPAHISVFWTNHVYSRVIAEHGNIKGSKFM
eukprot:492137-Pelagomonas_calceolata.AAC.11